MNRGLFVLILVINFFSLHLVVAQGQSDAMQESYATSNIEYYKNGEFDKAHLGELGRVSGVVKGIENGPKQNKILHLALSEVDETIWVALVASDTAQQLQVESSITVLGYFDEVANEQDYMAKLTTDYEYLIGLCVKVEGSELPIYSHQFLSVCVDWEASK